MICPPVAPRSLQTSAFVHTTLAVTAVLALAGLPNTVVSQCPARWVPTDGVTGGTTPTIVAQTMRDPDGAGPQQPALVGADAFTTAGDADGDGLSDGADVQSFVNIVLFGGSVGAGFCAGDFNGDGGVGTADEPGFVNRLLGV